MNSGALKIGWASRDVSTTERINIPGQFHARPSEGVHDPVTVTALVLDNAADCVIFVSCDVGGLRGFVTDIVREKVARLNPAVPTAKITMNATHTHTGASHNIANPSPETRARLAAAGVATDGAYPSEIPLASSDDYREFFTDSIAAAVVEAWNGRAPGGAAWGYSYATVAYSRRVVYFDDVSQRPGAQVAKGKMVDGHGKMYGNTDDDNFSHFEAGADPFVNLFFTFDANDRLTGAIVNIPCPSQCSEHAYKLSADYWNEVRQAIRAKYGDIFILPQCAAAGDLSPHILFYKAAQRRRFRLKYGTDEQFLNEFPRRDIAERVAFAFSECFDWAKKDIRRELPIAHEVATLELERRRITPEEVEHERRQLAELESEPYAATGTPQEKLRHDSGLAASRARCRRIISRFESQDKEPNMPMETHVVRVGDIAFATNRFELYMDFMHRIQARSPFEQTFVVQLSGVPGPEGGSYLATERGAANKGYSACLYCNQVSPKGGQQIVDATVKILKELSK